MGYKIPRAICYEKITQRKLVEIFFETGFSPKTIKVYARERENISSLSSSFILISIQSSRRRIFARNERKCRFIFKVLQFDQKEGGWKLRNSLLFSFIVNKIKWIFRFTLTWHVWNIYIRVFGAFFVYLYIANNLL